MSLGEFHMIVGKIGPHSFICPFTLIGLSIFAINTWGGGAAGIFIYPALSFPRSVLSDFGIEVPSELILLHDITQGHTICEEVH